MQTMAISFAVAAMICGAPVCAQTATSAATPAAEKLPPDRPPSTMTSREIAAYNEGLTRNHPYFITCRRILETGSLVKKARICRTNAQWRESFARGNDNARDTVDAMNRAPINSN